MLKNKRLTLINRKRLQVKQNKLNIISIINVTKSYFTLKNKLSIFNNNR